MELKLLHLYPECMSLYGEWANVAMLRRHLEELGNTVILERASFGEEMDFTAADAVVLGAGTEGMQKAVLEDLRRFAKDLRAAAKDGKTLLFTGTAFDLLGESITDVKGQRFSGIALDTFVTEETEKRIVGDVYGPVSFGDQPLVGFMNKCSLIRGVEQPLLRRCEMGFGNEKEGGAEGYHQDNVFATHLTGPVLVKNPHMAVALVHAIYLRRGENLPQRLPDHPYEEAGYDVTITELGKRMGK